MYELTIWDFVLLPIYLLLVLLIANNVVKKNIDKNPLYKYYKKGLFAKIGGGLVLCLVYTLYYPEGGDSTGYFTSAVAVSNVLSKSFSAFASIVSGNLTYENWSFFDNYTGYPWYWKDPQSFTVVRLIAPLTFLGFKKYLLTTVFVSWITFSGMWRIFILFNERFKNIERQFALAILFVPSVVFWGSGILKDSFTLSGAAWLIYSTYRFFITKEKRGLHFLSIVISSLILTSLKPYIFFSVMFGIIIWIAFGQLKKIESPTLRTIVLPILALVAWGIGSVIMMQVGSTIGGHYSSLDGMIEKAAITQEDLKRDYYGENSYDIGEFDASIGGIISKAPIAVISGLFRPFLWEAGNVMMLMSGLENTIFMILTLMVIFKRGPIVMVKTIFDDPFITFSAVFSITFAFAMGLSTANFGALVRYKIPFIPFYLSALFIMLNRYKINKEETKEKE